MPASTIVQAPSEPAIAQLWHRGQAAEPQHTPSTQLPVAHWLFALQTFPRSFFTTQAPPLQ
jgi:hypothetical protein